MFNYHNRQYIFRQTNGETWNFYCDSKQSICYSTLTKRNLWSNPVVLVKNVHNYFYADMDHEDTFHLLFQDNSGNIRYSRLDGQSLKTVPVLNSKVPSVYNKQLFLTPFQNSVYFFYVLQHDNSFMLACQVLNNGQISSPKVVDYVSGSSLPCAFMYDKAQNIYVFYQSYDGKYLQIGYKKFITAQKYWSDFMPVTKYAGNCEYPHVIIDERGIIHLCYQRRTPKFFEMVYQQKAPDKNLWTPEAIVHSSVHSFENASIVRMGENIVVYWIRNDVIYYNTGAQNGAVWNKPDKLNFTAVNRLQCLCFKSNSPGDRTVEAGDTSQLPPPIYPGNTSNGLNLAFMSGRNSGNTADGSQLFAGESGSRSIAGSPGPNTAGGDIRALVLDAFRQIQAEVEEIREGWSAARGELAKLTNLYGELTKELGKYSIRLNMAENRLEQVKQLSTRLDALSRELRDIKGSGESDCRITEAINGAVEEPVDETAGAP